MFTSNSAELSSGPLQGCSEHRATQVPLEKPGPLKLTGSSLEGTTPPTLPVHLPRTELPLDGDRLLPPSLRVNTMGQGWEGKFTLRQ